MLNFLRSDCHILIFSQFETTKKSIVCVFFLLFLWHSFELWPRKWAGFFKHHMTQGVKSGEICRTGGYVWGKITYEVKSSLIACICSSFSLCPLWHHSVIYCCALSFWLERAILFCSQFFWVRNLERSHWNRASLLNAYQWGWLKRDCRVHVEMPHSHDWQVSAGCRLGAQLQPSFRGLGFFLCWPFHRPAWASSQDGGWVPRESIPRGLGGSQKAPSDLSLEIM